MMEAHSRSDEDGTENTVAVISNMAETEALERITQFLKERRGDTREGYGASKLDNDVSAQNNERIVTIETKYYRADLKISHFTEQDARMNAVDYSCVVMMMVKLNRRGHNEIGEHQHLWDKYVKSNDEEINDSVRLFLILADDDDNNNDDTDGDRAFQVNPQLIEWSVARGVEIMTIESCREEGWQDMGECVMNAIQCAPWKSISLTKTKDERNGGASQSKTDGENEEDEEWGEFQMASIEDRNNEKREHRSLNEQLGNPKHTTKGNVQTAINDQLLQVKDVEVGNQIGNAKRIEQTLIYLADSDSSSTSI